MPRVIHFELGAVQPERATKFYSQVFGWQTHKWQGPEEYWLVTTGPEGTPGINGGIMRHKDGMPRTVNTIEVPNLDEYMNKVKSAGGQIVVERMPIQGIGYLAYGADTEGNIFGMMQSDAAAGK